MARHAVPRHGSAKRGLMRAGLAVTVAGIGLGAGGAATASAAPMPQGGPVTLGRINPQAAAQGTNVALHQALAAVKDAKLNPLAGTGVDPLDNTVGTQIADFKPVSTKSVTGPLTQGGSLRTLPVAGKAAALLPG
ncbi:hypothetical protein H1V43_07690 [Streptomyces sp. PSKA54]|uniref:Uncharacterized protein n=1 Tax=Streptomyces himalayensis subsp. aureolus TaxID=2758039 RepID=A0A7W2HF36_9ACTN|nr:hypothetical protein [Streptomyces himalayensis]MBA4861269.1 hypothetical protein [Streptomyces himalayensis subsp. aureolus]